MSAVNYALLKQAAKKSPTSKLTVKYLSERRNVRAPAYEVDVTVMRRELEKKKGYVEKDYETFLKALHDAKVCEVIFGRRDGTPLRMRVLYELHSISDVCEGKAKEVRPITYSRLKPETLLQAQKTGALAPRKQNAAEASPAYVAQEPKVRKVDAVASRIVIERNGVRIECEPSAMAEVLKHLGAA
jgi:hypothetical protein